MTKQKKLLLDCRDPRVRLPRQKIQICLGWILENYAPDKSLEVVFVTRASMKRLNTLWHATNQPTDVLSFPYEGDLLGEIFVCPEVARQEAKKRGLTFTSELVLYCVHGALHLVGYDDQSPDQRKKMNKQEVFVLGLANLLTDRLANS